ncbi:hypothetical protein [Teichococcus vastitatis]|uniref:Uncharacterized protein n=1 Tax=Teichococcus vastitatis TaxID=2307076 RepID=A0ABS9W9Y3_9PROT|nr:hypothetical protein [Pseudoroseomonas vastitatis]MCI0756104.1 hypothetical protein [Pseudoroseomonas vastitatis]
MPLIPCLPSSKMNTAITLLQHLATLASHDGEPCSEALFTAADYLQDVLDCAAELDGPDPSDSGLAGFDALMAGLADILPADGRPLHS